MSVEREILITRIGMPSDIYKNNRLSKHKTSAFSKVGLLWHNKILPKHFEDSAETEYDYSSRSKKYLKYKRKKAGSSSRYVNKPLQLTGTTKRMATSNARVTATAKRVTIRFRVPAYAGPRGKSSYVSEEMMLLSSADKRMITIAFKKEFEAMIRKDKLKVKKRIKR